MQLASITLWIALTLGAERAPWTTSRVHGTPEAAAPYAVEVAFPELPLKEPVALALLPGSRRIFVAQQDGKVVSFVPADGVASVDLALDLRARDPRDREQWMIYGLAFHPRFAANRLAFVCYVPNAESPDGTRVSRFEVTCDDPPRFLPHTERVVYRWRSGGHNGGCLEFGPDGHLYITTGDAVGPNPPDTLATGQNLDDVLSCILRIDVDREAGGAPYTVPADNPFADRPGARPEIWAYGFRNPWKIAFDPESGDLIAGDVGWDLWELVHRVERGGNYGWSALEGPQPVRTDLRRGPTPILPPLVAHAHTEAASITGGIFYRGSRLPELRGAYVYGDYVTGKIWGLRQEKGRVTWHQELADSSVQIVAFGEDADHELYIADHTFTGKLYRLVPHPAAAAAAGAPPFPRKLSDTGLFASTRELAPAPGVVEYEIAAEPWQDGAVARRFVALPGTDRVDPTSHERWSFPDGAVLVKHLDSPGDASARRRRETQLLHLEAQSWRFYTYAWDEAQADAELVDSQGGRREGWGYSSRAACGLCHNYQVGTVLGFHTWQLHRDVTLDDSRRGQLERLKSLGLLGRGLDERGTKLPRLVDPYDVALPLERRARSYLHANCAHCHTPNGGGMSPIQLAAWSDLERGEVIDARPRWGAFAIDEARIVAPGDPCGSVLYYRVATTGGGRMPRLGSQAVDVRGARLLHDWIASMPAPATSPSGAGGAPAFSLRTTRGALAFLAQLDAGACGEDDIRRAQEAARHPPSPEVRDLLERLLPEAERARRLGTSIDVAALLALPADADRGATIFRENAAAQCSSCHRARGEGKSVGPDLDGIGKKYTAQQILQQILEPSREVAVEQSAYTLVTRGGEALTGLLVSKDEREVVLKDARGELRRVPASDVRSLERQAESLMPAGLLRDLTEREAADLVAFLKSLE